MPIIYQSEVAHEPFKGGATYQTLVGDQHGSTPIRIGIQTGRNWNEPSQSKTEAWAREGVSQPSSRTLIRFTEALRVGDLVLLAGGAETVLAVGVVTGDARHDPSDPVFMSGYAKSLNVNHQMTSCVESLRLLGQVPLASAF